MAVQPGRCLRCESLDEEDVAVVETETSFGTLRGRDPRPVKVGHQPEASLAWRYDRDSSGHVGQLGLGESAAPAAERGLVL